MSPQSPQRTGEQPFQVYTHSAVITFDEQLRYTKVSIIESTESTENWRNVTQCLQRLQ